MSSTLPQADVSRVAGKGFANNLARVEVRLRSVAEAEVLRKAMQEALAVAETDAEYWTPEERAAVPAARKAVERAYLTARMRWAT